MKRSTRDSGNPIKERAKVRGKETGCTGGSYAAMSEHTPGPWTHRGDANGRNIEGPGGESVAWCGADWSSKTGSVPFKDNARLIAAAPALLRELAHLVRLLEPLEKGGGLATLNGARAAIALTKEQE